MRYWSSWRFALILGAYPLMYPTQEPHLECSPLNRAGQQIAFGDHHCPEPSAAGIVEPGLGQPHALVERFSAVGSPGDFYAWMAVVRRKARHDAVQLAPPRTSERARR